MRLTNPNLPPAEIFPKRPAAVIREEDGNRILDRMLWGFPHTITGASGKPIAKQVTNVRNYASPFWRSALKNPNALPRPIHQLQRV